MSFFPRYPRSTTCPKCGGKLIPSDIPHVIPWIDQKQEEIANHKVGGKKIDAYQSEKCDYLEFYERVPSRGEFGRF
jgi:predicted nucleic-acid-binding Zn-ribbon protein